MDWYESAIEYHKQTYANDRGLASLTAEWQRELVALMLVNREVNNGGYLQFFVNHDRETYEYANRALNAIGARKMAGIIECCQAILTEHSPGDWGPDSERSALMSSQIIDCQGRTLKEEGPSILPESIIDRLRELSWEFMNYPEDVADLADAHYGKLIANDRTA